MSSLILPAFIAGILMFIAPCTLPTIPTYLVFISGVSAKDLQSGSHSSRVKTKIILNSIFYVLGFSLVFIALGTALSWGGTYFNAHRQTISQIGGVFIILFGFFMLEEARLAKYRWLGWLFKEKKIFILNKLRPGSALSAFIFGATFSFGWTPCIGPILGSVLLLATQSQTVWAGTFLLSIFSLGMAVPFLLLSLLFNYFLKYSHKIQRYFRYVTLFGGAFLIIIGFLIVTNHLEIWTSKFFHNFNLPL